MKTFTYFAALLCAAAISAHAQQAPVAAPATPKVFAEWLKKDAFKVKFQGFNGFTTTYEMSPQAGHTMFYGWNDSTGSYCARGKVPTTFTLGDDGKLTLQFKFGPNDCPTIKYVFDQTKDGLTGEVYLKQGEEWVLRPTKVELVGYSVAEYQQALAAASGEKCAPGDVACAARVLKPALGTVVK